MGALDPPRKKTPIGDWPFTFPLTDLQNRDNPAPFLSPKQPLKLTNCREWVQSRAHKIWWKDKKPNICPQCLVFFNSSPFPSALGFIKMVSVHLARASRLFLQNPLGCLPLLGIWNKTKKNLCVWEFHLTASHHFSLPGTTVVYSQDERGGSTLHRGAIIEAKK